MSRMALASSVESVLRRRLLVSCVVIAMGGCGSAGQLPAHGPMVRLVDHSQLRLLTGPQAKRTVELVDHWESSIADFMRGYSEPGELCIGGESYRFIWQRAFRAEVVIRVGLDGPRPSIVAIERSSRTTGGPTARRIERELSTNERLSIREAFSASGVWSLPTWPGYSTVRDGSNWTFQLCDGERRHFLVYHSPKHAGMQQVGRLLISMSGLGVQSELVY